MNAEKLLDDLTEPQREAVVHVDGPLLIIAGAGSGKTRVITRRVAHLMSLGIPAASILAITFTNKAAGEMKSRVSQTVGREMRDFGRLDQRWPTICTFHSLCLRILRYFAATVGLPNNFSIYDSSDQTKLIKEALKLTEISSTNFPPAQVHATISNAKNQLQSAEDYAKGATDFYAKQVARVYLKYQALLAQNNALDFDDLLLRTAFAFRAHPTILQQLQDRFQYILIDEYQDTNHAQYIIAHALAMKHRNLCVVGDPDQCLPPGTPIQTPAGAVPIEKLKAGKHVVTAAGWGDVTPMPVEKVVARRYHGPIVKISTEDGLELRGTPNHLGFARLRADASLRYTYLMYKRGLGYRIGITRGVRASKDGEIVSGLQVRTNQEVADAMWILRCTRSAAEARFYEQYFSVRYGIPTMVFFARGRRMDITQEWIDRLYHEVDTDAAAERLMDDLHLDRRYPHHRPGAVTRAASAVTGQPWCRKHVLFTVFGDNRNFTLKPWHEHRVQLVTSDCKLRDTATGLFPVRDGVRGTWRIETSRKDYDDGVALARSIVALGEDMDVVSRARLTPNKAFLFMPLSHIQSGMIVPLFKDGHVRESTVACVEWEDYEGLVYDLSIPNTRNYIANGIVVHNSIYAWRGADIRNILDFEKDYKDAKVVRLEQNYRSTKTILQIASDLIAHNTQRKDKTLWTENEQGAKAKLFLCQDEHDEARLVADQLRELHDKHGHSWNAMAIFYRINALSRVMEDALRRGNIPYQIARGVEFYNRKEIKDVLAYLRVVANPSDEVSLTRIINVPTRGIGDSSVRLMQTYAVAHGLSLWDAMQQAPQIQGLSTRAANSVRQFVHLVQSWRKLAESGAAVGGKGRVQTVMEAVIQHSGLEAMLKKIGEKEQDELSNVEELVTSAAEYDNENAEGSLVDYLALISLVSDADHLKESGGAITLMTLHAAKGLEFPVVAMIGLEEGILPHSRARGNNNELEEERRLCFVGITRAQRQLILTKANYRTIRGLRERTITSPFLTEMPEESIEVYDRTDLAFESPRSYGATRDDWHDQERREQKAQQFRRGQLVRHPQFGIGRIAEISNMGQQSRAVIEFNSAGRKTLILEYARLEPVG